MKKPKEISAYYAARRKQIMAMLRKGATPREVGEQFALSAERVRQIAEGVRVRRRKGK